MSDADLNAAFEELAAMVDRCSSSTDVPLIEARALSMGMVMMDDTSGFYDLRNYTLESGNDLLFLLYAACDPPQGTSDGPWQCSLSLRLLSGGQIAREQHQEFPYSPDVAA
jgi:hypothetical protein